MKSVSPRLFLVVAGLTGALAVALGAVSAHLAEPAMAERLATAVRYLMWHALALLAVAWLCNRPSRRWAVIAGMLFITGQVLFCGSLILSSLTALEGAAIVAPAGGMAFIAGWLCLAVAGWRMRQ
ncbi:MAG: DUF423 domain-containing protein [Alphaproteobacteria bacterium]